MKKSVKEELRTKTIDDLNKLLYLKNQEFMKIVMTNKQGANTLSGQQSKVRKEIAIIKTLINEKVNKVHKNYK